MPGSSRGRVYTTTVSWPLSSTLLAPTGVAIAAVGLYFLFIRPAFLPEDIRYIGGSFAQLEAGTPLLASWLHLVFRVLGGFIFATGTLVVTLASTSFRARERRALTGALIAGVASMGSMVAVNFVLDSDFKWILLLIAVSWSTSLALFSLER